MLVVFVLRCHAPRKAQRRRQVLSLPDSSLDLSPCGGDQPVGVFDPRPSAGVVARLTVGHGFDEWIRRGSVGSACVCETAFVFHNDPRYVYRILYIIQDLHYTLQVLVVWGMLLAPARAPPT